MKSSGNEIYDDAYKFTGHDKIKTLEVVALVDKINQLGGFNEYKINRKRNVQTKQKKH